MNRTILKLLFLSATSLALLTGCTGSQVAPNNATQTGIATGALAGAAIGYGSGSHSGTNAVAGAAIGATLGGVIGNAVDSNNQSDVPPGGWQ
jgi:uncharacterized protein YcfJ